MGDALGVATHKPDEAITRGYQQEIISIIAQDTGSGKTHIAVLRMKIECDREPHKVSWFLAPTVALCEQQNDVIQKAIGSVGLIHGAFGREIGLLIFDEAHHANDDHPMNCIMKNFYFSLPEERPMILGLTASPMFGGNALWRLALEMNLDSVIRSPRHNRDELEAHVHRPVFKHVLYDPPPPYSTCHLASKNFQALENVADSMNIEQDPYVLSLRNQLAKLSPGQDRTRLDQKLSKTIRQQNSYTHKGIRDFLNTSRDICFDLGPWAADWYIQRVVEKALENASPYSEIATAWQDKEKMYLRNHLKRIDITPVSYGASSIENGISAKLRVLIRTLEEEKERSESFNEPYSGLIFVTRRDAVLALAAVLEHHPSTSNPESFRVGCLLGSSESAYRTAFLDITRKILRQPQAETLDDFRSGAKNLIVATAVAEEGLDIQACGNVIRWDVPNNMASWAQSRGRARRKRSSFVLMFESGGIDDARIEQFESLERQMVALYNANRQAVNIPPPLMDVDDGLELREFRVDSTGALLTLQASVSHLNHFCAVLPNSRHGGHVALYDIDPPDLPEGWHSLDTQQQEVPAYPGPFGSLPRELRVHTVERKYPSKRSAYQHIAFNAYLALYEAGLLNDHLLPLTSVIEPEVEEEVKNMLKDIEKRAGTASVTSQLNPWLPSSDEGTWWSMEVEVDGLSPLTLFTRIEIPALGGDELPVLYHPYKGQLAVKIGPGRVSNMSQEDVKVTQQTTRRLFWSLSGARMEWQHLDFAYLSTIRTDPDNDKWGPGAKLSVQRTGHPVDLTWVRDGRSFGKLYRFIGWHHDKLSDEEEAEIRSHSTYSRLENIEITYPLLIVEPLPNRANFLLPLTISNANPKTLLLRASLSHLNVNTRSSSRQSFAILTVAMTVKSLRSTIFPRPPLAEIPYPFLTMAVTAPVAEDLTNYQRLETLGDAVLKFVVAMNLLATYPLWHEGYLTRRKDHAVANSRLAKEAIRRSLFQWIIRTRFSPKRFKPLYLSQPALPVAEDKPDDKNKDEPVVGGGKTRKAVEQLSTKMLADVVESLIGAAYVHGGFDLGISCAQFFGLGLEWKTLEKCVELALSRVQLTNEVSSQLTNVEHMLGYTFKRKLLLVEALSHASYQYDDRTVSYERMEFLGDALLDMVVTDFLYNYPGKEFSPHDMHIRKSAVVNTHFLAYICLWRSLDVDASMPGPGARGQQIHLFQYQRLTFSRFEKIKDEIWETLTTGKMFPWAALTLESLVEGNMDTVRKLLRSLGILTCLDRIVRNDVDTLHPVTRLSIWAGRQHAKIEYSYKDEKGRVICTISVEGREPRGHASQEEARFAAAEKSIAIWAVD
ncbi:hypothetical protein BU15DRAFT_90083 [Melanogaster broomeanus]|nr:hypothetical protein BU15DRAFT_90083 [Melanogaster broomeanus]